MRDKGKSAVHTFEQAGLSFFYYWLIPFLKQNFKILVVERNFILYTE